MTQEHAERWHKVPMLALTFSTGVVDAVGFLGLDRVFTGNMTGNVVILGMALTGAAGLSILGPLSALAGFLVGTTIGGRALRDAPRGWSGRVTAQLAVVAVLLGAVTIVLAAADEFERPMATAVTSVLGLAMGVQAATARFVAVTDISTVAVTNTLIGLGADSPFGAARSGNGRWRLLAVLLIIAGAATGALLLRWHLAAGVALSTLIAGLVALLAARYADDWRPRWVR